MQADAYPSTTLWSSIIDNEVLKAVKVWLEPLPDRSLPAVGIQNAIFEVLPKVRIHHTAWVFTANRTDGP